MSKNFTVGYLRRGRCSGAAGVAWLLVMVGVVFYGLGVAQEQPVICSAVRDGGELVVVAHVPSGYTYAVLEGGSDVASPLDWVMISGAIGSDGGWATFRLPDPGPETFLRIRAGAVGSVPRAKHSGTRAFEFSMDPVASSSGEGWGNLPSSDLCRLTTEERISHVLNRLAYGPSSADVSWVRQMGVADYIEQQLNPVDISERSNPALWSREDDLFERFQPSLTEKIIVEGDAWRYFKGTREPPTDWRSIDFDDSSWLQGPSGFGYGDGDDETRLPDMRFLEPTAEDAGQRGYLTLYVRKDFHIADLSDLKNLVFEVTVDDGFVAYLNGTEIARHNIAGSPPRYNQGAPRKIEPLTLEFEIDLRRARPLEGKNVLAIQLHNESVQSTDASLIPSLFNRVPIDGPELLRIKGIDELQHLVHLRGIYARRQLQTVLGEFWENHFTTDFDKVEEYFEDLQDEQGRRVMSDRQASVEAAQVEFTEYQFFYDNAFGHFGDLLLYSATSPAQLIYLDNVLNMKEEPNENYAREILELFAFGVDNRYSQDDIEELSRCFTGWTVTKAWPADLKPFPSSSLEPPTHDSIRYDETVIVNVGSGWRYVKGTREPTLGTTRWADLDFDDSRWLRGATSIGYGDRDDRTVLDDMRNNYSSVYLRRPFVLHDAEQTNDLFLTVEYDDGFVAYVNGVEVGRSETMVGRGTPPLFRATASNDHEVTRPGMAIDLSPYRDILRPPPLENVLAIQLHNKSLGSSDLSIHPRLVVRKLLPGSIELGDPSGVWTFRFDPDEHDFGAKVLFPGSPYEIRVPDDRRGDEGLLDAVEIIQAMERHPSTSEFVVIKLVNKFVSDEISLDSYHQRTAPEPLLELVDAAITAWNSTPRPGHLGTVLRVLLDPQQQQGCFWSDLAYRSKIKTPIEFINSSVRALTASVKEPELGEINEDLGMELFTRDDPDGWSELGGDWMNTAALLERVKFAQDLAENRKRSLVEWGSNLFLNRMRVTDPQQIVDHFNELLFAGTLTADTQRLLIEFFNTDNLGRESIPNPSTSLFQQRAAEMISLMLSLPEWQFQ